MCGRGTLNPSSGPSRLGQSSLQIINPSFSVVLLLVLSLSLLFFIVLSFYFYLSIYISLPFFKSQSCSARPKTEPREGSARLRPNRYCWSPDYRADACRPSTRTSWTSPGIKTKTKHIETCEEKATSAKNKREHENTNKRQPVNEPAKATKRCAELQENINRCSTLLYYFFDEFITCPIQKYMLDRFLSLFYWKPY